MAVNYVEPEEFLELMKSYIADVREQEKLGLERPKIPERIGEIFLLIANNVIKARNYSNCFAFKDEMVSCAVESMVKGAHKFKPERSNNPFSYFTQFAIWTFYRRIGVERDYYHNKVKIANKMMQDDFLTTDAQDQEDNFHNEFIDFIRDNQPPETETTIKTKKPKKVAPNSLFAREELECSVT